jgi:hypothetical protein
MMRTKKKISLEGALHAAEGGAQRVRERNRIPLLPVVAVVAVLWAVVVVRGVPREVPAAPLAVLGSEAALAI